MTDQGVEVTANPALKGIQNHARVLAREVHRIKVLVVVPIHQTTVVDRIVQINQGLQKVDRDHTATADQTPTKLDNLSKLFEMFNEI